MCSSSGYQGHQGGWLILCCHTDGVTRGNTKGGQGSLEFMGGSSEILHILLPALFSVAQLLPPFTPPKATPAVYPSKSRIETRIQNPLWKQTGLNIVWQPIPGPTLFSVAQLLPPFTPPKATPAIYPSKSRIETRIQNPLLKQTGLNIVWQNPSNQPSEWVWLTVNPWTNTV